MVPKANINKMVFSKNNYKLEEHQNYLLNFIIFVSIIQNLLSEENIFLFEISIFCPFLRPCASAARAGPHHFPPPIYATDHHDRICILLLVGLFTLKDKKARFY